MSGNGSSSEWFDFARMDLQSAKYLLNMHPVPIEIICYHCEQAAEKMLKGALIAKDIDPPKTHDLVLLCKLCGETDSEYLSLLDSCVELTPYGVQARYPAQLELDESDMQSALRESQKICAVVEQIISREQATQEAGTQQPAM